MSGRQIAQYRIVRKLGVGGMGEVYLAEDTVLDREVALKLLPDELAADSNLRQRFIAEAKAASALSHPNVRMIYDVRETDDDRPYIVMEYVDGSTLDVVIRDGSIEINKTIDYTIQIADALEAAHDKRIVHRDIKPSNIALTAREQVKVLDFGLAKRLAPESGAMGPTVDLALTQSGQILGTPSYMSPEQALGLVVDHRSDYFSLGVVIYEMVTGRRPFNGSGFGDTIDRIAHAQPEAMARFNYDIPPELERITLKCLQKDKARRYQSASELLVDLKNLQQQADTTHGSGVAPALDRTAHQPGSGVSSGSGTRFPLAETQAVNLENSDILISHARIDDEPLPPEQEGWISQFERNLRIRLEQLLGEPVRILNLPMPAGDELPDETVINAVPSARTSISVVSPPFAKSAGCRNSVAAFCTHEAASAVPPGEWQSRLFKVLKTPIHEQELPHELADLFSQVIGFEFYEEQGQTGRVREFHERFGPEARQSYYERVYDLADEISRVLRGLKSDGGPEPAGDGEPGKTVYLATTTSDLNADRDMLRRELVARGHRVIPDRPLALEAGELESQLREWIESADLCVHPVGGRYGLVVEGAEQSVPEIQNRLAADSGRDRLIWIPRAIDVSDERQATWIEALKRDPDELRSAELIEDRLEMFKSALIDKLHPPAPVVPPPATTGGDGPARVYLIHDPKDEDAVEPLEDLLYEHGIETMLPAFDVSEAESQQAHLGNLRDCDAAIVFYGAVGRHWVDFHVRDLAKAAGYRGSEPIPVQAVYLAPPFDRRKERFKTLSALLIRQENDDFASDVLTPLVDQIKALRLQS